MTLNQLKVFVLVVRLGSFRAAANALGVSEPAVSQNIAALRQSLGDPLLAKTGANIELTDAGQRIVGLASQMVNLAVEVEATVRRAQGGPALLRVVADATPADATVPALLQAFTARAGPIEATLAVSASDEMAALLVERLADVAIGPRLQTTGVQSAPLMKYRLVVAAASSFRGRSAALAPCPMPARSLADHDWLVDPSGLDPRSAVGSLLARLAVPERRINVFPNQRAAWAAAAAGQGLAPAVEHMLQRESHPGLAILPIEGMPLEQLWYVNMLPGDRRSPITQRLQRFLTSPEAMQAMFRSDGRVPASRFKPPVHITLWT